MMGQADAKRALMIGLAARIAYSISGALAGELANTPLRVEGEALLLEVPPERQALFSERVGKHLNDLAKIAGRKSARPFV